MIDKDFTFLGEKTGNLAHYLILKRVIEAVFNNLGIKKILEIIENTINRPIVVIDMGFRIIEESPSISKNIRFHYDYKENTFLDESCIQLIRSHYLYSKISELDYSSAIIKHPELNEFLVASIKVSAADILMLVVFEDNNKFTSSDLLLIKKICQVLSVEFQKENSFNRYRLAIPNHILISLLKGKSITSQEFFDKMSYLKWVNAKKFNLMLIKDSEGENLGHRVATIINALKLFVPINHCLMYEDQIVIFFTGKIYHQIFEENSDEFKKFLISHHLRATISTEFNDILLCRHYYLMAQQIMQTAEKFSLTIADFKDIKYYIIGDLIRNRFAIADFCHPCIISLLKYDQENKTELLKTLAIYLEYKNNIEIALEKLYIHRSTLFYRIKKIKELCELNLEQTEEIADLFFSIKILAAFGEQYFLEQEKK